MDGRTHRLLDTVAQLEREPGPVTDFVTALLAFWHALATRPCTENASMPVDACSSASDSIN